MNNNIENKVTEEINLDKVAWQAWEKANYESAKGINPHAYILGYKDCYAAFQKPINLHIEENNSVVANQNSFNAEQYHGSKEHFNDIANGRD